MALRFVLIFLLMAHVDALSANIYEWEECRSSDNRIRIEPLENDPRSLNTLEPPSYDVAYRVTIRGTVHSPIYREDFEKTLGITFSQETVLEAHDNGLYITRGIVAKKITIEKDDENESGIIIEDWLICQFHRDYRSPPSEGIYLVSR